MSDYRVIVLDRQSRELVRRAGPFDGFREARDAADLIENDEQFAVVVGPLAPAHRPAELSPV